MNLFTQAHKDWLAAQLEMYVIPRLVSPGTPSEPYKGDTSLEEAYYLSLMLEKVLPSSESVCSLPTITDSIDIMPIDIDYVFAKAHIIGHLIFDKLHADMLGSEDLQIVGLKEYVCTLFAAIVCYHFAQIPRLTSSMISYLCAISYDCATIENKNGSSTYDSSSKFKFLGELLNYLSEYCTAKCN